MPHSLPLPSQVELGHPDQSTFNDPTGKAAVRGTSTEIAQYLHELQENIKAGNPRRAQDTACELAAQRTFSVAATAPNTVPGLELDFLDKKAWDSKLSKKVDDATRMAKATGKDMGGRRRNLILRRPTPASARERKERKWVNTDSYDSPFCATARKTREEAEQRHLQQRGASATAAAAGTSIKQHSARSAYKEQFEHIPDLDKISSRFNDPGYAKKLWFEDLATGRTPYPAIFTLDSYATEQTENYKVPKPPTKKAVSNEWNPITGQRPLWIRRRKAAEEEKERQQKDAARPTSAASSTSNTAFVGEGRPAKLVLTPYERLMMRTSVEEKMLMERQQKLAEQLEAAKKPLPDIPKEVLESEEFKIRRSAVLPLSYDLAFGDQDKTKKKKKPGQIMPFKPASGKRGAGRPNPIFN